MKDVLASLLRLQALEFEEVTETNAEALKTEIRARVPQPILGHYDRLVARGKKGVAIVRNQVCTGCHMRLPIGTINTLMQGTDIQLCDTCGRYLSLEPEPVPAAEKPAEKADESAAAPVKKTRKPRKQKTAAPVE